MQMATIRSLSVAVLALVGTLHPQDALSTDARERAGAAEVGKQPLPRLVPRLQSGRYTRIDLSPESAERDLLQQVVETAVPDALHATVGDGLRHLLARSGYRLCESKEAAALYALPLPAAHLHLGPLTLRDALTTMAGSAWTLSVDEVSRIVCFARSAPSVDAAPQGATDKHSARQP